MSKRLTRPNFDHILSYVTYREYFKIVNGYDLKNIPFMGAIHRCSFLTKDPWEDDIYRAAIKAGFLGLINCVNVPYSKNKHFTDAYNRIDELWVKEFSDPVWARARW